MFNRTKLKFSTKEYTIGGVVASAIALISLFILGYSIWLSFAARGLGEELVGVLGLLSMVLSVFGLAFGLLSYKEQDRKYGPSFFGTFTNGLILIVLVLFIMIGL